MSEHFTPANDTVAILIGASDWPELEIPGGESFLNSFSDLSGYLRHSNGLALTDGDILEIFDTLDSPDTVTGRILDFLSRRVGSDDATVRNVILYLLGQGQIYEGHFYFALRRSKKNQYPTTFLPAAGIARLLTEGARNCRHFVIVDACHAAAVEKATWQSPKGACVLCSSRANDLSQSRSTGSSSRIRTQFTGAMLDVVHGSDSPIDVTKIGTERGRLSFETLCIQVRARTKELYGNAAVLPELRSVSGPRIESAPLFPIISEGSTVGRVVAHKGILSASVRRSRPMIGVSLLAAAGTVACLLFGNGKSAGGGSFILSRLAFAAGAAALGLTLPSLLRVRAPFDRRMVRFGVAAAIGAVALIVPMPLRSTIDKPPLVNRPTETSKADEVRAADRGIIIGNIEGSQVNIVAGDQQRSEVTYSFQTAEARPISMRDLATVLGRHEAVPATFFRPTGLSWSDLEQGYHPYSSEDADQIIAPLDLSRYHLLVGKSAAWREQLARFVGWELIRRGKHVYITDAWTWPGSPIFPPDWSRFDAENSYLIVENAQVRPDDVDRLFSDIRDHTRKMKVLVSTDPSIASLLQSRPYVQTPLLEIPRTTIDEERYAKVLVGIYAKKALNREVGPRTVQLMTYWSRGPSYSLFFRAARENEFNLWLLSALLSEWRGGDVPDEADGQAALARFVGKRVLDPLESRSVDSSAAALTVAFYSYFSASVPRSLLTDDLGFEDGSLTELVRQGVVTEGHGSLVMSDRWLCAALLDAVEDQSPGVQLLKRKLGVKKLGGPLVIWALKAGIPDYDSLLLNLSVSPLEFRCPFVVAFSEAERTEALAQLSTLLSNDRHRGHVGRALVALANLKKGGGAEVLKLKLSDLKRMEGSVKDLAWLITGTRSFDPEIAKEFAQSLVPQTISEMCRREPNVGVVGSLLWAIDRVDPSTAEILADKLERDGLSGRLAVESEVARVGWVLETLAAINKERAKRFASCLSTERFVAQITSALPTGELAALLWGLVRADAELAGKLARSISIGEMLNRIRETSDSWTLGILLWALGESDQGLSARLVGNIGSQHFLSLLNGEQDTRKLKMLACGLRAADPEFSTPILETLLSTLDAMEAKHRRDFEMFSKMNATAMALAGQAAEQAHDQIAAVKASEGFTPPLDSDSIGAFAVSNDRGAHVAPVGAFSQSAQPPELARFPTAAAIAEGRDNLRAAGRVITSLPHNDSDPEVVRRIARTIDDLSLVSMIDQSADYFDIAFCIRNTRLADAESAQKLVSKLDRKALGAKLADSRADDEYVARGLNDLLKEIAVANPDTLRQITPYAREFLMRTKNLHLIREVFDFDQVAARELLAQFSDDELLSWISAPTSLEDLKPIVYTLNTMDPARAGTLFRKIGAQKLRELLEADSGRNVGSFLSVLGNNDSSLVGDVAFTLSPAIIREWIKVDCADVVIGAAKCLPDFFTKHRVDISFQVRPGNLYELTWSLAKIRKASTRLTGDLVRALDTNQIAATCKVMSSTKKHICGLDELVEEIYRADPEVAVRLQSALPELIPQETIDGLAKDFVRP